MAVARENGIDCIHDRIARHMDAISGNTLSHQGLRRGAGGSEVQRSDLAD